MSNSKNRSFRSNDFVFRPTSLGQRLAEIGLIESPHLIREARVEVINGDGKHRVLRSAAA